MKKSCFLSIIATLLIVVTAVGCNGGGTTASPSTPAPAATTNEDSSPPADVAEKKLVIGATILTREHVFWTMVEESLNEKAQELGVDIIVSDGKSSADSQYAQIQDFVTQKVDAIIVAPVSSAASASAAALAKDAGIPVFSLVIDTNGERVSFIGVDNILGGELAGEYAAKVLGEEGQCAIIVCIMGLKPSPSRRSL